MLITPTGASRADSRVIVKRTMRLRAVTALAGAVCCLLAQFGGAEAAEAKAGANIARMVASPEPGWPQWRGQHRDGVCRETGLLGEWPAGGPRLLWKAGGLGFGYSAPIIVAGRIYLAGDQDNALKVFALDDRGRRLWAATNGRSWKTPYPGARASCTYSAGRIYHEDAHGRVACFEAATGKELWAVDVLERFQGKNLTWALADCLLVDGPRVFVTPGGRKALMAALDSRTGETIWASSPLAVKSSGGDGFEQASYGSPILIAFAGRKLIVNTSLEHVFGVDADSGELLWTHPLSTRYLVIAATPVLVGDQIFVTAPDTELGGLLRMVPEGRRIRVEQVWRTQFDNCHGGVVPVRNELFGAWYRRGKGWAAVDLRTGATRQALDGLAMGSVLAADGRLYCLGQDGEMALVEPAGEAYEFRGRFRLVPDRKTDAWTHPVILEGRLYLRYHEELFCYDIRSPREPR